MSLCSLESIWLVPGDVRGRGLSGLPDMNREEEEEEESHEVRATVNTHTSCVLNQLQTMGHGRVR